jgi:D-alanyl-lipoteichoic acid acyltransferase DltB (MBOAT superfamily)
MLFNSSEFILYFLPICVAGFYAFGLLGRRRLALGWLTAMSFVFYGWWNLWSVPLLAGSILVNFYVGRRLARSASRPLFLAGVTANVLLLGFFKYTGFVGTTVSDLLGLDWTAPTIALPLAISFFTFQQIAFLADCQDGVAGEPKLLNYGLFITFFPHLIAGPITHHKEMMPQFDRPEIFTPRVDMFSLGTTVFLIGLFKKVVIADSVALYVGPVFDAAAAGVAPTLLEAWGGALAYAMQMYFDFSGYSDMAVGLGLLFGISLPLNFASPYKAASIIEFWQRWHMTLTRFLTAYIYNPIVLAMTRRRLAANKSVARPGRTDLAAFAMVVAVPTILTMFISGVWHGAGWQFIVFGLLHGVFLTVNHGWRTLKQQRGWSLPGPAAVRHAGSVLLTFLCATLALVFFRAADVTAGLRIVSGMAGANGVVLPENVLSSAFGRMIVAVLGVETRELDLFWVRELLWLPLLFWIVWFMPNVGQWMRHYRTALAPKMKAIWYDTKALTDTPLAAWHPTATCGVIVGVLGMIALLRTFSNAPSEFLYFQF